MRICKEVVQCNQLCLRGALSGTVSQNALADHYVRIGRDGVYAGVGHGQIGAFGFDAVVELGSTHGAGTHTGIASKDDLADLTDIYGSRFRNLALACAFISFISFWASVRLLAWPEVAFRMIEDRIKETAPAMITPSRTVRMESRGAIAM